MKACLFLDYDWRKAKSGSELGLEEGWIWSDVWAKEARLGPKFGSDSLKKG